MVDDDIRAALQRIEAKLDLLLSDAGLEPVACPCGNTDFATDQTFGEAEPRIICRACGQEAANG